MTDPNEGLVRPEPRRLSVWARVPIYMILAMLAYAAGGILAVAGYGVWLATQGEPPARAFELLEGDLQIFGLAASQVPQMLLLLLATWICRRFLDKRSWVSLGLGRPSKGWPWTLFWGLAIGALAIGGMICLMMLSGVYRFTGVSHSLSTWVLLPSLVVAAFNEELIIRGYVLRNLLESGGVVPAVLISSTIFWLLHGMNPAAWSSPWPSINLFGAGIVLALAALATGDLWFPTLIHFAWNACQGSLFQLPISGLVADGVLDLDPSSTFPNWLSGGPFGFEGSVLATLSELILGVIFYRLWKRRGYGLASAV